MEDKNRFSFISTQGFAERLRRRRLGLGLRKQDLAAQVGVSLTTIQQYENGQLPKGEFAVRLGAALRCSLDWLLAGQGNVEGALQDQWAGLVMVPAGLASFETSNPEAGRQCGAALCLPRGFFAAQGQPVAHGPAAGLRRQHGAPHLPQ